MSTEIARSQDPGALIESVVTKGDLAKLSPQERTQYYVEVCRSVGLNPFTRPLEYISLNGKLVLYARRDAADQLRKLNGISVDIVSRDVEDDLVVVHVRARDKTGRSDEDFGAVSITGLRGEAKANAVLKAITKAKRRVTLSIAGLGFLDETEVDDIEATNKTLMPQEPIALTADLDAFAAPDTPIDDVEPDQGEVDELLSVARAITFKGWADFRQWYLKEIDDDQRMALRPHIKSLSEAAHKVDEDVPAVQGSPSARPRRRKPGEPTDAEIDRQQNMLAAVLGPDAELDPAPIEPPPDFIPAGER